MTTDIHTHLDLISSLEAIPEILNKCKEEGITSLFNISVDFNSNFISRDLAKKYKEIYFSVGIHPEQTGKFDFGKYKELEKLLSDDKCIGIGEIGLDYYHDYGDKNKQIELFEFQLNVAKQYNKPVILHTRDSFDDAFYVINKNEYKDIKGVFHCFSYSIAEAKKIIDRDMYISFAGNLTFKNARNLHETAKNIRLDRVLVETDSPFLTPVPFRGKKNYPYMIKYTIKFLSELLDMPINILTDKLNKNIRKLFFYNDNTV